MRFEAQEVKLSDLHPQFPGAIVHKVYDSFLKEYLPVMYSMYPEDLERATKLADKLNKERPQSPQFLLQKKERVL